MKNFTKLFTLLIMAAMSMGVMAETAILNWKIGAGVADATSANSVTGAAGTLAPGFTIDMPDNTTKTLSGGGWITHSETNYKSIKNSKGQRVRVQLPSGYEAQEVTLYVYANGSNDATLSNFNGSAASDVVPSTSDNEHPVVITKSLENETSFDFTFSGEQVCFIAVISYRSQPTGDSYTFGYEATLDGTNLSALAAHEDGCAQVTVSALSTSNETNSGTMYHGDETEYAAARTYRNKANEVGSISSKADAETNNCGVSYKLTIATGYQLSLTGISSDLYVDKTRDMGYEYVILNKDGETVYSSEYAIAKNATSGHSNSVALKADAVRNLTGEVTIKFYFWISASTAYLAIKDFKVTGLVSELPGEGSKSLSFLEDFEDANPKVFADAEPANVTATWVRATNKVKKNTTKGIQFRGGDDSQKLTIAVDEGSYIESIVFTCGDGSDSEGKFIEASVLNVDGDVVDTYISTAKKTDVTWNCGDIRESELTFDQTGAGNVYIKSVTVTYRLKPATTTYVRTHTHMNLNTLCYPYQIDSYTGATFYTMLYKVVENTEVTEVVLQEHVGVLEAGKPYFYVPEGTELVCNYSGDYTAAGNDGNGVYGSYTDLAAVTSGMYVTYNNQIIKAGDNVKIREYRAYINMDEVSLQSGANLVPGRRQLRIASVPQQTTGVENTSASAIHGGSKILRNGQLFIIRNGVEYNVNGQMTK